MDKDRLLKFIGHILSMTQMYSKKGNFSNKKIRAVINFFLKNRMKKKKI